MYYFQLQVASVYVLAVLLLKKEQLKKKTAWTNSSKKEKYLSNSPLTFSVARRGNHYQDIYCNLNSPILDVNVGSFWSTV